MNRSPGYADLSRREREILMHVASGLTNRQIGRELNITEGTVKAHLHSCFTKLGVSNRTEAAIALAHKGDPGRVDAP